jgi:hypothetical protein
VRSGERALQVAAEGGLLVRAGVHEPEAAADAAAATVAQVKPA